MKLEQLQPNAAIRGILPDALVTVASVQWFGSEALELTYKTPAGKVANELLYRQDKPQLEIVELAKGKLTTAPEQHTGEGIFFTSRASDCFEIESHHLRFIHAPRADDSIVVQARDTAGTRVRMRLANDSPRRMREVFDAFTDPEEYSFDKDRRAAAARAVRRREARLTLPGQARRQPLRALQACRT
jgi:hypothetical protein